jgi:hypothetical protein
MSISEVNDCIKCVLLRMPLSLADSNISKEHISCTFRVHPVFVVMPCNLVFADQYFREMYYLAP